MDSTEKNYIGTLEIVLAVFCILIPVFLRIADDGAPFRPSISDYVLMERGHVFGMVLTIAAMLFIYNGVIQITLNSGYSLLSGNFWKSHGYNIFLGFLLFGVLLFPLNVCPKTHYALAILFFVGSSFSIAFFGKDSDRIIRYIIAVLSIIALVVHIIDKNLINLFWAEWLALFVIGIRG
ncbi:DUF7103 family protein [Flagellimonas crocea]|uniref:DUF7103 family protein n=1 Tax=Flagellimonas crocea TaxID=3067311 RepID=UPI00296FC433|nr:hypothetical protein [Muricauda sp. DH64]